MKYGYQKLDGRRGPGTAFCNTARASEDLRRSYERVIHIRGVHGNPAFCLQAALRVINSWNSVSQPDYQLVEL